MLTAESRRIFRIDAQQYEQCPRVSTRRVTARVPRRAVAADGIEQFQGVPKLAMASFSGEIERSAWAAAWETDAFVLMLALPAAQTEPGDGADKLTVQMAVAKGKSPFYSRPRTFVVTLAPTIPPKADIEEKRRGSAAVEPLPCVGALRRPPHTVTVITFGAAPNMPEGPGREAADGRNVRSPR